MLRSEVADLKNSNPGNTMGGGTIVAGLFIREFTEGKPWIHVDMAPVNWLAEGKFLFDPGRHRLRRQPALRDGEESAVGSDRLRKAVRKSAMKNSRKICRRKRHGKLRLQLFLKRIILDLVSEYTPWRRDFRLPSGGIAMIEATSCGGVVIFRGKILVLYKNYRNKYEGWVLPREPWKRERNLGNSAPRGEGRDGSRRLDHQVHRKKSVFL